MSAKWLLCIVPLAILLLQVVAVVRSNVRENRARRLFMHETGGSEMDWDLLPISMQKKWIETLDFDREAEAFIDDYRKGKSQ